MSAAHNTTADAPASPPTPSRRHAKQCLSRTRSPRVRRGSSRARSACSGSTSGSTGRPGMNGSRMKRRQDPHDPPDLGVGILDVENGGTWYQRVQPWGKFPVSFIIPHWPPSRFCCAACVFRPLARNSRAFGEFWSGRTARSGRERRRGRRSSPSRAGWPSVSAGARSRPGSGRGGPPPAPGRPPWRSGCPGRAAHGRCRAIPREQSLSKRRLRRNRQRPQDERSRRVDRDLYTECRADREPADDVLPRTGNVCVGRPVRCSFRRNPPARRKPLTRWLRDRHRLLVWRGEGSENNNVSRVTATRCNAPLRALPTLLQVGNPRRSLVLPVDRRHDTAPANEQHVACDQDPDEERRSSDMPEQHLTEVENVEEGAEPRGVEAVLRLTADPLRVEVLLDR